MIDYLLDVKPLEDAGVADSEIAVHLASRTSKAMPCSAARIVLQESGAVVEDPVAGTRTGLLIDHYSSLPQGNEKSLLGWFISHVFGNGDEVSTNTHPRSVQWNSVTLNMPESLQYVAQSLIEKSGGQPNAGTTAADVAASRDSYEADLLEEQRRELIMSLGATIANTWINPAVSDGSSTEAEVRAAIKAGL